jgi:hypothetical protein
VEVIPADPRVHIVLLLEELDGDGECGAAAPRPESRREGVRHVGDEPDREARGVHVVQDATRSY